MHTFARKSETARQAMSVKGAARGGASKHRPEAESILHLQRAIGNRAMQWMLEASPEAPTGGKQPRDKESVRFSALPPVAVPVQRDAIETTLSYDPSITSIRPPASPTKFGETEARIEVNKSSATHDRGVFHVELVVETVITYWVDGGNKKDVVSDADPKITQANYPRVVSDLTPAPAAVRGGGLDLFKPRQLLSGALCHAVSPAGGKHRSSPPVVRAASHSCRGRTDPRSLRR